MKRDLDFRTSGSDRLQAADFSLQGFAQRATQRPTRHDPLLETSLRVGTSRPAGGRETILKSDP